MDDPCDTEEGKANLRLIFDAFTIYQETALTPRQLAEQRRELLAVCEAFISFGISTPKDYATKGADAFNPLQKHIIDLQNQARAIIEKCGGSNLATPTNPKA